MKLTSLGYALSLLLCLVTPVPLCADELSELRLFHDSELVQVRAGTSDEQNPDLPDQPITLEETWVQDAAATLDAELPISTVYRYHGFISSLTGIQYLINGVPVTELDTLELVSVKKGGRILELRSAAGQIFQLAIGQSIDRKSL